MTKTTLYIIIILPLLTSCSFYGNFLDKKELCETTIKNIVKGDNEATLKTLNIDPADSAKARQTIAAIEEFRRVLVENYGTNFDTWFMSASKKFSTKGDEPDITTAQIQVDNGEFYGVITFIINDSNGSLQNIRLSDEKRPVPRLTWFWLFGLLPLTVLAFNIYSARKVVKSSLNKKWAYLLLCILLNTPTLNCFVDWPQLRITYDLGIQMLSGVSFGFMGYDNYALGCGLPIGSLITHLIIHRQKRRTQNQLQTKIAE